MYMGKNERSYYTRYYAGLKGLTITKTGVSADGFPFFEAKAKDGTKYKIEVSQDPEGNGPGFLFGLPTPEVKR